MFSKILSSCVQGIDGHLVEVEVDISSGLPQFNIVGLPDSSVRESIERVRAALKNCGYDFPMKRITVNLAPAYLRKEGAAFDLGIAVGILLASGQLQVRQLVGRLEETIIIGELSLDGALKPIPGVLAMMIDAHKSGIKHVILPVDNAREASLIKGINLYPLKHLVELKEMIRTSAPLNSLVNYHDKNNIPSHKNSIHSNRTQLDLADELDDADELDYADVRGQYHAKRALMIAAAGFHNILLIGPPGSGKTMLMRRMTSILPDLSENEALEVTKIYSVARQLQGETKLISSRPFRSPHHTISTAGIVGGGSSPKPGEISLAHRGVLFLDEFPEFPRHVLEVLRQPMEDKQVTISRSKSTHTFPTDFILAASMNPCPCGYKGAETHVNVCLCSEVQISRYRSKISGPLLDRIDLHVEVPRIDYKTLKGEEKVASSTELKAHIHTAQLAQHERYCSSNIQYNSQLKGKLLQEHCALDSEAEQLLRMSFDALSLSARAHDRILKIARTIADLEASPHIKSQHISEAIQYRTLDRKLK